VVPPATSVIQRKHRFSGSIIMWFKKQTKQPEANNVNTDVITTYLIDGREPELAPYCERFEFTLRVRGYENMAREQILAKVAEAIEADEAPIENYHGRALLFADKGKSASDEVRFERFNQRIDVGV
jgi:hypothetical protein